MTAVIVRLVALESSRDRSASTASVACSPVVQPDHVDAALSTESAMRPAPGPSTPNCTAAVATRCTSASDHEYAVACRTELATRASAAGST